LDAVDQIGWDHAYGGRGTAAHLLAWPNKPGIILPYFIWMQLLWMALFALWQVLGVPWGLRVRQ
jgi:hypothetical protein